MKAFKTTIILLFFSFVMHSVAVGATTDANDKAMTIFKNYLNTMVQKVEKTHSATEKRQIMNNSFDKMIRMFDRTSYMTTSESNKKALKSLKGKIQDSKYELNGTNGYKRIQQDNLDEFANYTLQNFEQANTVTLSLTAALLILVLVILLL